MSKVNIEYLKNISDIYEPDPRNLLRQYLDNKTQTFHPYTLDRFHEDISKITLNTNVPETIRISFETAKNLYLYSWFVYRFFNVSEHQALCCLEFALREKYYPPLGNSKNKPETLSKLLKYAIKEKHVKNEDFAVWHNHVRIQAEQRSKLEAMKKMEEDNLDEVIIDHDKITINEDDMRYDYLALLQNALPYIRNIYAHGSSTLRPQSLNTFDVISTIINKIYSLDK